MWQSVFAAVTVLTIVLGASAKPRVEKLAPNLYAYVSDKDHSSNSTFLIGQHGILVVDTGLNKLEGQKLLSEIRAISSLPVQFIVNTHYHPDHQGGNGVVGPDAAVISSPFTRERTVRLLSGLQAPGNKAGGDSASEPALRPATETLEQKLIIFLDDIPVEIISPGPAHTMGDVYVYFPLQKTVATGDLYLTNSSPAMDQGSASNWMRALDEMLAFQAEHFVPGHFEVSNRATMNRFRDYLSELYAQVEKLQRSGAAVTEVRERIDMRKYSEFRQYPQFHATYADNAEAIYHQLQGSH